MQISDILRHKQTTAAGATVVTIDPADTVGQLLALLAEHKIGAVPVTERDTVVGVVSERDVARRLHDRGPAVLGQPVREIMTSPVVSCHSGDSVDAIAATMTERRFRHLPVIDDGRLVGIVTIGDVVSSRIRELEASHGHLESYITG